MDIETLQRIFDRMQTWQQIATNCLRDASPDNFEYFKVRAQTYTEICANLAQSIVEEKTRRAEKPIELLEFDPIAE